MAEGAEGLLEGQRPEGLSAGGGRPIVYRLDLSQPNGLFLARRFQMRDRAAMFVTDAPRTELRKFLQLFNTVLTPVTAIGNTGVLSDGSCGDGRVWSRRRRRPSPRRRGPGPGASRERRALRCKNRLVNPGLLSRDV